MTASDPEADGRRRRGNQTRAVVASAAEQLFLERGFAATTVQAIAVASGVSLQTVYYSFGTKEQVLSAALDAAIAGDHEPVPTLRRPWALAALQEPDPRRQLRQQTVGAADILGRSGPLLEVLRAASSGNESLRDLWSEKIEQRKTVQRAFIKALREKTDLRPGVSPAMAVDVCALFLGPENHQLLTVSLGWSRRRWIDWTSEALELHLLP